MSIKYFSKLSIVAIAAGVALSGLASSASAQMGHFEQMCGGPLGPAPAMSLPIWRSKGWIFSRRGCCCVMAR